MAVVAAVCCGCALRKVLEDARGAGDGCLISDPRWHLWHIVGVDRFTKTIKQARQLVMLHHVMDN
jgi:hypothetical protein